MFLRELHFLLKQYPVVPPENSMQNILQDHKNLTISFTLVDSWKRRRNSLHFKCKIK